jgi:hypothetical protein
LWCLTCFSDRHWSEWNDRCKRIFMSLWSASKWNLSSIKIHDRIHSDESTIHVHLITLSKTFSLMFQIHDSLINHWNVARFVDESKSYRKCSDAFIWITRSFPPNFDHPITKQSFFQFWGDFSSRFSSFCSYSRLWHSREILIRNRLTRSMMADWSIWTDRSGSWVGLCANRTSDDDGGEIPLIQSGHFSTSAFTINKLYKNRYFMSMRPISYRNWGIYIDTSCVFAVVQHDQNLLKSTVCSLKLSVITNSCVQMSGFNNSFSCHNCQKTLTLLKEQPNKKTKSIRLGPNGKPRKRCQHQHHQSFGR